MTSTPAPDPDCVFCGIVEGRIPADLVHEDDQVIAFPDRAPQAAVHLLVVPRDHHRDVRALGERPELLARVASVASRLADSHADGEFRLIFNTGASAGQTVFHVHAHVLAGGPLAEGAL